MKNKSPKLGAFPRRLLILALTGAAIIAVFLLQMVRLSIVEGSERRAVAQAQLRSVKYLPTTRGRIIDRKNRIIAGDGAGYDLAVAYEVITGDWVRTKARQFARHEVGPSRWYEMSPHQRDQAINNHLPQFQSQLERFWNEISRTAGVDREELERHRNRIRSEVASLAAVVWDDQRRRARKARESGNQTGQSFKPLPILEQESAHVILGNLPEEKAFEFRRLAREYPGLLEIKEVHQRRYLWPDGVEVVLPRHSLPRDLRTDNPLIIKLTGVADHIIGAVRPGARAEDLTRRPFRNAEGLVDLGGYRINGDEVGILGLERSFENHLRGTRGMIIERKDSGEIKRIPAIPGKNLNLSLDFHLQARIQAILSPEFGLTRVQPWHHSDLPLGTSLNAAAVVIEVQSGEILALVSTPTRAAGRAMTETQRTAANPWVNRPVEAVYPPGSIIKPLVLCIAVQNGVHNLANPIECIGHYYPHLLTAARCWIYREKYGLQTHGPLLASEAIGRSCNIFFYTLADRLGLMPLMNGLRGFGLGQPLNIGLSATLQSRNQDTGKVKTIRVGESAGHLADPEEAATLSQQGELNFTTVIAGIGQGPAVTWTPLQAANAYATLARHGVIRDATLLTDPDLRTPPNRPNLNLPDSVVSAALEGLRQSVMELHGTGNHITYDDHEREPIINAKRVTVWAKTGTAQAPPLRGYDSNHDGVIDETDQPIKDLDHAWFVGLVGPDDTNLPMYAIAVIVEYGGSGGRVAGPVANQIIHALQDEEYLPGGDS